MEWENESKSFVLNTTTKVNRGRQANEIESSEDWSLLNGGKVLTIKNSAPDFRTREQRTTVQIFEK